MMVNDDGLVSDDIFSFYPVLSGTATEEEDLISDGSRLGNLGCTDGKFVVLIKL